MNKPLPTIAITTIALLLLFSCGKDDESAMVQAVSQKQLKSVAHLSYIPADTPYVIAALEPLPKDVELEPDFFVPIESRDFQSFSKPSAFSV